MRRFMQGSHHTAIAAVLAERLPARCAAQREKVVDNRWMRCPPTSNILVA